MQTADRKFTANLGGNRAGRLLQAHLSCISLHQNGDTRDSAMQESLSNERVLLTAISQSKLKQRPMPCGLPKDLPKYIAVCNLSGERLILHSDNCCLIRKMCTRSSLLSPRDVAEQIKIFEAFPFIETAGMSQFVLISYSLPWQGGIGSAFWSVSACKYDLSSNVVEDRVVVFTSHSLRAFQGKPVLCQNDLSIAIPHGLSMALITPRQMKDFNNSFCSSCVDFTKPTGEGGTERTTPDEVTSSKQTQLESIIQALKLDRSKDHSEINKLKTTNIELESQMMEIVQQCQTRIKDEQEKRDVDAMVKDASALLRDEKAKELLELNISQRNALNAEIMVLETSLDKKVAECSKITRAHERLAAKLEEVKRQSTSKDTLGNAANAKHRATIKGLEDSLAASNSALDKIRSDMTLTHKNLAEEQTSKHAAEVCRLKTALEGKKRILAQLSEVNERRDGEIHSLQTVDTLKNAAIVDLDAEIVTLKEKLAASVAATKEVKVRSVSVRTCTASTTTHSCQTTQTDPVEEKVDFSATLDFSPTDDTHSTTAATQDGDSAVQNVGNSGTEAICKSAVDSLQLLIAQVYAMEHKPIPSGFQNMPFHFLLHPQHQFQPQQMQQQPQQMQQQYHHPHHHRQNPYNPQNSYNPYYRPN